MKIELKLDFDKAQFSDDLIAQPFYFIQKPEFVFGDLKTSSKTLYGQFILWKDYILPKDMMNQRFFLRDTTLSY